jgi:uncharacterized protein (TIGR00730 family)
VRSVCVFSGSSLGARPAYAHAARALAVELVARGTRVVYGGAAVGLMGIVADTALAAGGEVVGVIPQRLVDREIAHTGLTELHVTTSMHERKAVMGALSDGFVALPGGYGTLDELAEVLTWTQLGLHGKPLGLLDVGGFFVALAAFFDHATEEGFVRAAHRDLVLTSDEPARLLDAMERWTPPVDDKWSAAPPARERT